MYCSLGRNSDLSVHNKLLLHKQVICPVLSYGVQLWGCASDSSYQSNVINCTVSASWYFRNSHLHRDLGIEEVTYIITKLANSHEKKLQNHINTEVSRLLNVNNITKRLKRKKPF
jgi:hypothetical protein